MFWPPLPLLHAAPSSREGTVSCLSPRKTTCTLPSSFPGSGGAWWWWLISLTRCSFQICPLFINTRDCFRILGCLRSIHFAGEESLRERFKWLSQGVVREKPLLGSTVFKSKSNSYFTHFTPFKSTTGELELSDEKVTFSAHGTSAPSPWDLDPLSDPTATCRVAGVSKMCISCFMDQHCSGCDHILGGILCLVTADFFKLVCLRRSHFNQKTKNAIVLGGVGVCPTA